MTFLIALKNNPESRIPKVSLPKLFDKLILIIKDQQLFNFQISKLQANIQKTHIYLFQRKKYNFFVHFFQCGGHQVKKR